MEWLMANWLWLVITWSVAGLLTMGWMELCWHCICRGYRFEWLWLTAFPDCVWEWHYGCPRLTIDETIDLDKFWLWHSIDLQKPFMAALFGSIRLLITLSTWVLMALVAIICEILSGLIHFFKREEKSNGDNPASAS